jgi:predicted RNA-binding Zn ribbon-like protein
MKVQTPKTIKLLGGRLALDFANSIDWDDSGVPRPNTDALAAPDSLVQWGRRLGVIARGARVEPDAAELASCVSLRRTLHEMFAAIATERPATAAQLQTVRAHLAESLEAGEFYWEGDHCSTRWRRDDLRRVRFAVVNDAHALLSDPQLLARVRLCPGHNCGWLFFDSSGRQRWCSMQTCGSRAKMRRLYQRRRRDI